MTIPIGLQLYSVRGECAKDLPGALRTTAEIGYAGAEPWGYNGQALEWQGHPVQDIRTMYDDNGLKCCGIHLAPDALSATNLPRTIEFNKIMGNRFLIVAADQKRMGSVAGVMELAGILNDVAERLAPEGMFTGYHAHGFDFAMLDNGQVAWDILFSNTQPAVIMQMDIGNCAGGGGDPIAILRKFPNRARSVHLKDFGGAPDSVIGEGKADWPEVIRLCETLQNTEWYVVEEGSANGLGFDIPARSRKALRAMGK
jgi:sugar phosphate isomerase/epimerase